MNKKDIRVGKKLYPQIHFMRLISITFMAKSKEGHYQKEKSQINLILSHLLVCVSQQQFLSSVFIFSFSSFLIPQTKYEKLPDLKQNISTSNPGIYKKENRHHGTEYQGQKQIHTYMAIYLVYDHDSTAGQRREDYLSISIAGLIFTLRVGVGVWGQKVPSFLH